jgi:hypothetical protein
VDGIGVVLEHLELCSVRCALCIRRSLEHGSPGSLTLLLPAFIDCSQG